MGELDLVLERDKLLPVTTKLACDQTATKIPSAKILMAIFKLWKEIFKNIEALS